MISNKFIILFTLFFSCLLLSPKSVDASNEPIRLSGYNLSRSGSAFLDNFGNPLFHPAGTSVSSTSLGGFFQNTSNFGVNGVVPCSIDLRIPTSYIASGSLVDDNGNLLLDVFFATNTTQSLSTEEILELQKFLSFGGILYVHSTASTEISPYEALFDNLSIDVGFGERYQVSSGSLSSDPLDNTLSTNGPFGTVGSLSHGPFRAVNSNSLNIVAYNQDNTKNILVDGGYNAGYLAISGLPLHVNIVLQTNNQKYFGNLVALACNRNIDNSVTLDVPSFKQGLVAYDGVDPAWENQIYDDGDKQSLWCDTNRNGATMAECGCALTSASMVMRYFGVEKLPDGSLVNPATLNSYFKQNSSSIGSIYTSRGFVGGNVNWHAVDNATAIANRIFTTQTKLDQPVRENYSIEKIKNYIDQGIPVIQKVTGRFGVHWVVIKGYDPDTNRLIINDPIKPDQSTGYQYLDELYAPVQSLSMVTYKETHSDFSSLQFSSVDPFVVTDQSGNQMEAIQNSQYVFDEYVGDATSETEIPAAQNGIYFFTIKIPSNQNFQVNSPSGAVVNIESSNIEGDTVSKSFTPKSGLNYTFNYEEEKSGNEIVLPIRINMGVWAVNYPAVVTILGSSTLDVTSINQSSVRLGKTGTEEAPRSCTRYPYKINGDRYGDINCFFDMKNSGLDKFSTRVILTAKTNDGFSVIGKDSIRVF